MKAWVLQRIIHFFVVFFEWSGAVNRVIFCDTDNYILCAPNRPEGARTRLRLLNFKISPEFSIRFLTINTE